MKQKQSKNLRIVITDPDVERRGRLREALRQLAGLTVFEARSLFELDVVLAEQNRLDLVIISSACEKEPIKKFLSDLGLKAISHSIPVALALRADALGATFVAEMYSRGVVGFIVEPFSVEAISELLELVRELKDSSTNKKVADKLVTSFLLRDALKHFDKVVELRIAGAQSTGYAGKDLRDDCSAMRESSANLTLDELGDLLISRFANSKPRELKPGEERARRRKNEVKFARHPGFELVAVMRERKVSADKVIAKTKIAQEEIEQLLRGELDLTEAMAEDIARVVGRSKEYWLGLQKKFDDYRRSIAPKNESILAPQSPSEE